ncbi:hypothetical protein BJ912DRAFT_164291 [Pholiota molesta]|nr:hypothetical protein BJ912DRAFT_164291 [Pholiota molesta]
MAFTVQRVENPTDEQLCQAVDLFHELMQHDRSAISISGGDRSLMRLQALTMLRACSLRGEYYTATNTDQELVGFAAWTPPGQDMFNSKEERSHAFGEFMLRVSDEGRQYFATYIPTFSAFVDAILGPNGKRDSWWLHMTGVRRDYQKKGILRKLINLVQEKASMGGDSLGCTATDDANVPVYIALGFTRLGQTIMPSPWGDWPAHLFSLNTSSPRSA